MIFKLIIFLYLIIILIAIRNVKLQEIRNLSVFIENKKMLYFSFLWLISYVMFFFFFFKLSKVFLRKKSYFDLNSLDFLNWFKFEIQNEINKILLIIFTFILVIFIRSLINKKVYSMYLKLHYYYFFRFKFYRNFFYGLCNLDLNIYKYLNSKKKFLIYCFLTRYGYKVVALLFIFYGSFFNDGIIYIGFLPYYGLYYYIYNKYNNLTSFISDFDRAVMLCYYPSFVTVKAIGLYKISLYKDMLVFDCRDFQFLDFLLFYRSGEPKENQIYFFSWKPWYSGIDIFDLATNNNPKFKSFVV